MKSNYAKTNWYRNEILFAHKLTGQRQKFKGKIFDRKCPDFLYTCFSVRYRDRLVIYLFIYFFVVSFWFKRYYCIWNLAKAVNVNGLKVCLYISPPYKLILATNMPLTDILEKIILKTTGKSYIMAITYEIGIRMTSQASTM